MKQGKEILEKHLKEMDRSLSPIDQLKMRIPTEIKDIEEIYLERFLNSREGSIDRATSAAKKYCEAAQNWNLESIKTQEQPTQFVKNFPAKWLGNDLEGRFLCTGHFEILNGLYFRWSCIGDTMGKDCST